MSTVFLYIASFVAILLVGAFAIVLLRRVTRREPLFAERDWLALFGCRKAEALRLGRWLRLLVAVAVVSVIGFFESVLLLPLALDIFLAVVGVTVGAAVLGTPRFFRLPAINESIKEKLYRLDRPIFLIAPSVGAPCGAQFCRIRHLTARSKDGAAKSFQGL